MKDKIIERRIKIGSSVLILFLLFVSSSSGILTITDEGLEFDSGRWIAGESDYVIWRTTTNSYVAKNMNNGTIYTSGSNDLADLLNRVILEMYTYNNVRYGGIYGGKISFKSGRYNLYNQVNLMPGTCIEGNGGMKNAEDPATTIVEYSPDAYLFFYDGSLSTGCAITIKNLAIKSYFGNADKTVIYMDNTCGSVISGVTMMGYYKDYGIYLGGHCHANYIVNCDIYHCDLTGIYLKTLHSPFLCCNSNVIRDTRVRANGVNGIYIDEACVGNSIINCAIEANGLYGINLADDGDEYAYGDEKTTIIGTNFEETVSVRFNYSMYTTLDSAYSTCNLTSVGTGLPQGVTISNCWVTGNTPMNFSGNNSLISGNTIAGIIIWEGNHTTIFGNEITNTTHGIQLNGANTPNTKIYSNYLGGGSIVNYQNDTTMFDNVGFTVEQFSNLDYIYSDVTIYDVLTLNPIATAPGTPTEGMIYANSTDNHLYFYNGTAWNQLDN